MKKRTILTALVAGALAIAGCGDDESSAQTDAKATGNGTDRAFVADMIPHHESAVEMAEIAQERGESDFVKGLADDIVRTQNAEVSIMRREEAELVGAGVEKGSLGVPEHMMGMDVDLEELKTATPFDKAFIEMMVPHHKGAVEMAEVELARGADPELKTLAQEIIDAQKREIEQMDTWRKAWYPEG